MLEDPNGLRQPSDLLFLLFFAAEYQSSLPLHRLPKPGSGTSLPNVMKHEHYGNFSVADTVTSANDDVRRPSVRHLRSCPTSEDPRPGLARRPCLLRPDCRCVETGMPETSPARGSTGSKCAVGGLQLFICRAPVALRELWRPKKPSPRESSSSNPRNRRPGSLSP